MLIHRTAQEMNNLTVEAAIFTAGHLDQRLMQVFGKAKVEADIFGRHGTNHTPLWPFLGDGAIMILNWHYEEAMSDTAFRVFKYRLYPTKAQVDELDRQLRAMRWLYNSALEHRRWCWRQYGRSVGKFEQMLDLKFIRAEHEDVRRVNAQVAKAIIKRLDEAFAHYFRRIKSGEKPGYPRFKGRNRFNSMEYPAYGNGCKLEGRHLTLQNVGPIRVRLHQPLTGTIKTVEVKREANGWYACITCTVEVETPAPSTLPPIGIDMGLASFLATSDGEIVANPRYMRKAKAALRRAQRKVARRKKGSNRRRKAVRELAKAHQHVANQRRDFQYKTAKRLWSRYGAIYVEDLNVRGMSRGMLSGSMADAAWGSFLAILTRKAAEAGGAVVKVNPRNTSQACSNCGALPLWPKSLKDRVHVCACGYTADRDVNAARNILLRASAALQSTSAALAVLG